MVPFNFSTFPLLETDRLILRETRPSDVESVFQLRNNPQSIEFTARPPYQSMKEAEEMISKMQDSYDKSDGISWAICLKEGGALNHPVDDLSERASLRQKMIGGIGFWRLVKEHYRAEIGYSLLPKFWNQGIITESLIKVVDFGFEHLQIHSIEANLNPNNRASIKVLEKAGFSKEGYFNQNYFAHGEFLDTLTYGKVKQKK